MSMLTCLTPYLCLRHLCSQMEPAPIQHTSSEGVKGVTITAGEGHYSVCLYIFYLYAFYILNNTMLCFLLGIQTHFSSPEELFKYPKDKDCPYCCVATLVTDEHLEEVHLKFALHFSEGEVGKLFYQSCRFQPKG